MVQEDAYLLPYSPVVLEPLISPEHLGIEEYAWFRRLSRIEAATVAAWVFCWPLDIIRVMPPTVPASASTTMERMLTATRVSTMANPRRSRAIGGSARSCSPPPSPTSHPG